MIGRYAGAAVPIHLEVYTPERHVVYICLMTTWRLYAGRQILTVQFNHRCKVEMCMNLLRLLCVSVSVLFFPKLSHPEFSLCCFCVSQVCLHLASLPQTSSSMQARWWQEVSHLTSCLSANPTTLAQNVVLITSLSSMATSAPETLSLWRMPVDRSHPKMLRWVFTLLFTWRWEECTCTIMKFMWDFRKHFNYIHLKYLFLTSLCHLEKRTLLPFSASYFIFNFIIIYFYIALTNIVYNTCTVKIH